jgi:hypothetical protein
MVVQANGYLLVWADEETGQTRTNGDLHVNFRLSQTGEAIGLFDPAGRLIDGVSFGAQTENVSHGRFPDGAVEPFVFMTTPTPKAPNVVASTAPAFTDIALNPGGTLVLTWSSEAGRTYRLQYKASLTEAEWTTVPGDVTAAGTSTSRTLALEPGHRFFQVLQVQ